MTTKTSPYPQLEIKPGQVAGTLFWIAVGLNLAHIFCMIAWYEKLFQIDDWLYISFFDLDEEESIGTWFSTSILLLVGLLTLFQARFAINRIKRWHISWWLLGIGFCILSLDEIAAFHEFVNSMSRDHHWTEYGMILVIAMGLVFLPFIIALPGRTRLLFIASGAIYVGGAVGVEWATIWHQDNDLLDTLGYNLWNALEEGMEMGGIILYVYAILDHISRERDGLAMEVKLG